MIRGASCAARAAQLSLPNVEVLSMKNRRPRAGGGQFVPAPRGVSCAAVRMRDGSEVVDITVAHRTGVTSGKLEPHAALRFGWAMVKAALGVLWRAQLRKVPRLPGWGA